MKILLSLALAANVPVTFQVNDSYVKDKLLPEVAISISASPGALPVVTGATDGQGRFQTELPPGKYVASYRARKYVPILNSPLVVKEQPQTVTTTLTMLMEETSQPARSRVQLVLNWGSRPDQVQDADAHLLCGCRSDDPHVFYQHKRHSGAGHSVELDVDHTDWAGPETVTLLDVPPGSYYYWVYDYSGALATLGGSEVVVRAVFGDRMAGEYRIPEDVTQRLWRPFKALVVDATGQPWILPFTAGELQAGEDRRLPPSEAWSRGADDQEGMLRRPERAGAAGDSSPGVDPVIQTILIISLVALGFFATIGITTLRAKHRSRRGPRSIPGSQDPGRR